MDWFLYDNGLRQERVKPGVMFRCFKTDGNLDFFGRFNKAWMQKFCKYICIFLWERQYLGMP